MIDVTPLGEVSIIRLDRPEKRNAQTPKMLANLTAAIERALSARAIVLSGMGDVFCAGFDLTLCRDDGTILPQLLTGLSKAVRALRSAPCPVVVSGHGGAIAGGCALVAASDIVVTNAQAKLGYPVVKLGISPAVNVPLVSAAIGDGATRTRALDPGLINGREALRLGLAHYCVDSVAECEPLAIKLAQQFAEKPRHALAYTKHWLGKLDQTLNTATLDAALEASLSIVNSDEQQQRLAEVWQAADKKK